MSIYGFSQCQSRSGHLMQDISTSTNVTAPPAFTEGVGGNGNVRHYMWHQEGIKWLPICILLACKGSLLTTPARQHLQLCVNTQAPVQLYQWQSGGQLDASAIRHQTHKAPEVFQTQLESTHPMAKALNPPQVSAAWGWSPPSLLEERHNQCLPSLPELWYQEFVMSFQGHTLLDFALF